jgi:DMSO/TMAO reductase YedYZ molybdopterin-dependent catalytic subunit
MKNPKWLTAIELSDKQTFIGYWEQRGWSAGAEVTIMSRFDTPDFGQEVSAPVTLAGIAFAADRGISKVEVTTDRGRTWHEAILKRELAKASWRLWRFDFDAPGPGDYRAAVRAYDGRGNVQRQGSLDPFPRGTSGFDQVAFTVR